MELFAEPVRVGGMDDQEDWVEIDIFDAAGHIVATLYGEDVELAKARASWFVLHANARFAQLVPGEQERLAARTRQGGRS